MLSEGIMDLRLRTGFRGGIVPGQFVGIYTGSDARLLPRPISICEAAEDEDGMVLRLVYRIVGQGTAEFALLRPGMTVMLLGILGNGFPVGEAAGKHSIIVGGGIGIPPLLQLAHELREGKVTAVLGYRGGDLFLADEFRRTADDVLIATEDGSYGTRGNVLDAIRGAFGDDLPVPGAANGFIIYTCGPAPMLRGIKAYSEETGIPAYISLEERMACGVGACLGCVCHTVHKDPHSHVNNARICTEGPVFPAAEVIV